ncbi:MAG: DUF452 family protein, partial [Muribaculaceae bacterium]|nr:DUF452 family protein [Muribaculaceae bacterium]
MKFLRLQSNNSGRLLLIFAGWGMDPNPFRHLRADGYDIAVVWDYTDPTFLDADNLKSYSEIVVIAWSMGVFAAGQLLQSLRLPITLSIAVNGTPTPVSDSAGIPVAIFEATLSGLTPDSLERFNRRMCGSASAARSFAEVRPARDIESLRQELQAIGDRASEATPTPYHWDIAVIGQRDMIFPPAAQRAAWQGHDTIELDAPHLPGFQHIIDHLLIKKDRVAHSFESSRDGYEADAGYQHSVADLLVYKLLSVTDKRHFSTAIEIGAGSGRLTAAYCNALTFDRLELWDIAPAENACLNGLPTAISITDDAEVRLKTLPDDSVDLIISASTLQWFNSPANGVRQIERVLRPGGLAAIALYVDGTYESFSLEIGATQRYSN